jgi:hypothetical protein
MAQQPLVGQGLLIIEASRSHSDTPHWLGLLWTSNQPDAETSDNTQHSQETDNHVPTGFESTIPASERPQTNALDRAATGIIINLYCYSFLVSTELCVQDTAFETK